MGTATQRLLVVSLTLAAAANVPGTAASADTVPDWENEHVVGISKLEPHAAVYPFVDAPSAATLDRTTSRYYRLLNGRWKFAFSPTPEARPVTLLRDDVRRHGVGHDPGAVEHREERLRAARLRQHRLRLGLGQPAAHPARAELRRLVSPPLRGADDLAGASRAPHLPGRLVRLLSLGQREEDRLQRGQPGPGGVRHHRCGEAWREPARGRGLSLHGRLLSRVPGLLADVRHLPRRDPVVHGAAPRGRFPRRHRPRRAVPGRDAEPGGRRRQRRTGRVLLHGRSGTARHRRPARLPRPLGSRPSAPRPAQHADTRGAGQQPAQVVGREAQPLHAAPDPQGRERPRARRRALEGRLPRRSRRRTAGCS